MTPLRALSPTFSTSSSDSSGSKTVRLDVDEESELDVELESVASGETVTEEPTPIVLVQGFLGTPGVFAWDYHVYKHQTCAGGKEAEDGLVRRRILVPSLGPVSSLHDRACELFYSLVGGRVDYGKGHSEAHGHERYGRHVPNGLFPSWSKDRPLHFVGHSIGGTTIIKLQYLLAIGHFGEAYHPDMILSVNTVSAPFRGTQLVYNLGESTTSAPAVRPFSPGNILGKFIHVLAYFAPLLPESLDVHADARKLSYRDISPAAFVKHLWRTQWSESKDAAPFDMTFEAADEREVMGEGRAHPNTYYRSHVAVMTTRVADDSKDHHHYPRLATSLYHNSLYLTASSMGTFDFSTLVPRPSFCTDEVSTPRIASPDELEKAVSSSSQPCGEEYWANDGVVPLFSQWHPLSCKHTSCTHFESDLSEHEGMKQPIPGRWTVTTCKNSNHLSFTPGPFRDDVFQRTFWTDSLAWIEAIESSRP